MYAVRILAAGVLAALLAEVARPQGSSDPAPLEVGDPAPPLRAKEWVKGAAVDLVQVRGKHVVVLEFWATWCKPCVAAIPELTALQKRYQDRGLLVIGVNSGDEKLAVARKFVAQQGERMAYTVALEEPHDRPTYDAYMKAVGAKAIPYAFVIDKDGRLAWHGDPRADGLEHVLEQIFAGRYDRAAARERIAEQRRRRQAREKAAGLINQYVELCLSKNRTDEADQLGRQIMTLIEQDAVMLERLAREIAVGEGLRRRDLKLARHAAELAHELTRGGDARVLGTYAYVLWEDGEQARAVELLKKAVELAKSDQALHEELRQALQGYEEKLRK